MPVPSVLLVLDVQAVLRHYVWLLSMGCFVGSYFHGPWLCCYDLCCRARKPIGILGCMLQNMRAYHAAASLHASALRSVPTFALCIAVAWRLNMQAVARLGERLQEEMLVCAGADKGRMVGRCLCTSSSARSACTLCMLHNVRTNNIFVSNFLMTRFIPL